MRDFGLPYHMFECIRLPAKQSGHNNQQLTGRKEKELRYGQKGIGGEKRVSDIGRYKI